jgi:hypothetical protein
MRRAADHHRGAARSLVYARCGRATGAFYGPLCFQGRARVGS